MLRRQVSPKAHGAWLGAGTGQAIAGIIVGLIQYYGTGKALPQPLSQAIYVAVAAALSFAGAFLMPSSRERVPALLPGTYGNSGVASVTVSPAPPAGTVTPPG